jgi:Insect cuticle protein
MDNCSNIQVTKCITNDFPIFSDSFETSDGVKREEEAQLKNIGSENESLAVRGSFSFVGDDGQTYTVDFIADENGYQPSGAHLPAV